MVNRPSRCTRHKQLICATCFAVTLLCARAQRGVGRLVSVPDLHGDYDRAVEILATARLLDPQTLTWVGGSAILVQTGDIVDRGDRGKDIYELFFRLAEEARLAGGSVVNLLGNHELMNIQGDLRYVSRGDYAAFGGKEARAHAWGPSGWLGKRVRRFPAAAKVGGVLFVHAGLAPELLADGRGLRGVNEDMAAALDSGDGPLGGDRRSLLLHDRGPVWTRDFSLPRDQAAMCEALRGVLELAGAGRMVVGHTIQESFAVSPRCGGRLLLGDTAVSGAYGGEMSFIEYALDGGATAVYPRSGQRQALPPLGKTFGSSSPPTTMGSTAACATTTTIAVAAVLLALVLVTFGIRLAPPVWRKRR